MASEIFIISDVNPNDSVGGAGCLCSEAETSDTEGPFTVFTATETDSGASPHAVLCAPCARAVVKALDNGEVLSVGEKDPIEISDDDVIEIDDTPEI